MSDPHELPKFKSPAEYRASEQQIKDRMESYNKMKAKMKARKGYIWSYDAPLANVPDQTFKRKEDKLGGRKKNKKRKHRKTRKGRKKKRKGGLNLSGCGEGKVRTKHGCGLLWNANPLQNPLGCCRDVGAMPSFLGGRRKKTKRKKTKRKKKKFRKGSKSKTHKGKDFETRKTSKNYSSKRWKRITGRRTRRAPLFPFV